MLLMERSGVAASRAGERQLALKERQALLVDANALCQRITLKRVHSACLAERLLMHLPAHTTLLRREACWSRDVMAASKSALQLCLAHKRLGAGGITLCAKLIGAPAHHCRAHQGLLAARIERCSAASVSCCLIARSCARVREASAGIGESKGTRDARCLSLTLAFGGSTACGIAIRTPAGTYATLRPMVARAPLAT